MLRLGADEHFNNDIVRGLVRRQPNLDIVRVQDVGLSGADDVAVLEWAANEKRVLVDDAAYGLMLWDGESKGTLNSVINMIRQSKPVVVYLAPQKTFQNLRSVDDVSAGHAGAANRAASASQ